MAAPALAHPGKNPKQEKDKGRGHEGKPPKAEPQHGREDRPQPKAEHASRGRGRGHEQGPPQAAAEPRRGRVERSQAPAAPPQQARQRLAEPQQQQRIAQQQQRIAQYGAQLDQQQRLASEQAAQLQQQKRTAQYGFQQQYVSRLREQQVGLQSARTYNYGGDPYFYTPYSYRYVRAGRSYETNDYGATVLRQGVNYGYQEGFEAGRADRQDHWRYDYQHSYAYLDANYGYGGFYVERADYNYYFRQGFRRGYEDGYYSRSRYGSYTSGKYVVQAPVLKVIINFQMLR